MNLYELLPVFYRQRDQELGLPLQHLVSVLQEQYDVLEADIAQLHENWFIETCQDWVVPYIGDLIAYQNLYETGIPAERTAREENLRTRILISRRDVANTIHYRRRKGALSLLEQLAYDDAGWPARAVEFGRLASASASANDQAGLSSGTVDVRRSLLLNRLGTPLDTLTRNSDVRRLDSHRTTGRFGGPNVALFISRLRPSKVTASDAEMVEEAGDNCFTFSPLGNDSALFSQSVPSASSATTVAQLRLPGPITRRDLLDYEWKDGKERAITSDVFYGEGKSIAIYAAGWRSKSEFHLVGREKVIAADLTDWRYRTPAGHVAVDPELGRICFASDDSPADVLTTHFRAFGTDMGGGEYKRPLPAFEVVIRVEGGDDKKNALSAALRKWKELNPPRAAIEFTDSRFYDTDRLHLELADDQHLTVRAANGVRPIVHLLDAHGGRSDAWVIHGKTGSSLTLDGIVVTGRGVQIHGDLKELHLQDSTLVPGWGLSLASRPKQVAEPSLLLQDTPTVLRIKRCIVGAIQVRSSKLEHEPNQIEIQDSIIDAASEDGEALCSPGSIAMFANLRIRRSTVFGRVCVHTLEWAENCIFRHTVNVARRQSGCLRFCYLPQSSRTPRRYQCQPDLALVNVAKEDAAAIAQSVAPIFLATHYGSADYARLADSCPDEIRTGADDDSEMGVFHDLFQPQREANLLARLEDFVPAGADVGLIFTS